MAFEWNVFFNIHTQGIKKILNMDGGQKSKMSMLNVARLHDQIIWVNLIGLAGLAQKRYSAAISWQGMLHRESRK